MHILGVLGRDCQHLALCLFSQVLKMSLDKYFLVSSSSTPVTNGFFQFCLSNHNFLILYYLAPTVDVFHCPLSWNYVLYHMITTFKSLSLTAIRKNNVTSRIQIAFRYVLGILQLVSSFFFSIGIYHKCTEIQQ